MALIPSDSKKLQKRRRTILLVSLAVFLPLTILLGLQYKSLAELEKNQKLVRHAALEKDLNFAITKLNGFYETNAERAINISPEVYKDKSLLIKYLKSRSYSWDNQDADKEKKVVYKKPIQGVRLVFFQDYENRHKAVIFDPMTSQILDDYPKDISSRIWAETYYYALLLKKKIYEKPGFSIVDDADFPMILNRISDEKGNPVAIAGIVVCREVLRNDLLPNIASWAFPSQEKYHIKVKDHSGTLLYERGKPSHHSEHSDVAMRTLGPILPSWSITVASNPPGVGTWVANGFFFNMMLSFGLALALMGGVFLALRTAAREMHLSEMKADFVSNVSHELRTPLASIRVFGEFLRLGRVKDEAKVREYGEFIETEGQRLTQLINNILDFSKIESGLKTYKFKETDIASSIRHTLRSFDILAINDLKITFNEPEQPLPMLPIDNGAFTQAIANLLDNAIKYRGEGNNIEISLKTQDDKLLIEIRDDGIGIAEEEIGKIFERFHRVGTGLVHDVKGSGLGLSIVKHVVDAHQGEIKVKSRLGQGSTFSILLPLHKPMVGGYLETENASC